MTLNLGFRAPTALSQRGYPSLRFQESKIIFDKSESSTKEIEFNLRVGVATKEVGTGIKYHKLTVVEGLRSILPYKVRLTTFKSTEYWVQAHLYSAYRSTLSLLSPPLAPTLAAARSWRRLLRSSESWSLPLAAPCLTP